MTYEEMQAVLARIVQSQERFQMKIEQAQAQAQNEMAEMRANLTKTEANLTKTEANLAKTEAIVNSNARAIEAIAHQQMVSRQLQDDRYQQTQAQLAEFIRTVAQFVASTETRLERLETK